MGEIIDLKPIEEPEFNNSSWNFKIDEINSYAFWNKAF